MNLNNTFNHFWRRSRGYILVNLLLILASHSLNAQEPPPRPVLVTVNTSQYLSFGAFYQGTSGGSVIIYSDGSRSKTGDIVLLGMGYNFSAGLYDLVGNPGTLISILDSSAELTGDNGGTLTLQISSVTNPPYPIIITSEPPFATQVSIGATLIVGTPLNNPPGNYSGSFTVTFVQE
jgi:hypothetical protein